MPKLLNQLPKKCRDRNQCFSWHKGKRIYQGVWGSHDAEKSYKRFIAALLESPVGRNLPRLSCRFLSHANKRQDCPANMHGSLDVEYAELEAVKYYVLFYDRIDACTLQDAQTGGKTEYNESIMLLLECATAVAYIGALTDEQRVVFNAEIRKKYFNISHVKTQLVPILLIPAHAKLLLNQLLNKTDWDKERDIVVGIAEWVRGLKYTPSAIEKYTADDETIDALKRKCARHREEEPEFLPVESGIEDINMEELEYGYTVAKLHEISIETHSGKGWAKIARLICEQRKKPFTKTDVERLAGTIEKQIKRYRVRIGYTK
jgi:hypothetical protein